VPKIVAITRSVSSSIARCELTYLARAPIDFARAVAQHARYEAALAALGCTVVWLPEAPDLPDAVFVEDAAVVLDRIAVVTRPGAASRRPETASVAAELARWRALRTIEAPGTLDGGDVLRVGARLFVGRTGRSNADGIAQLARFAAEDGLEVVPVEVRGCLHLKSAASEFAPGRLLVQPEWLDLAPFAGLDLLPVDPSEPSAANVLRVGPGLLVAAAYPRTRARIEAEGIAVQTVDASELAKAEGALTCCSLIVTQSV
jgi:dimethylargininase